MKILHVLYQSLPQVSGSSIRSRDILMSQQEIGLDVIAITSPFQSGIKNDVEDIINGIRYIRTTKRGTNTISDKRDPVFLRILRLFQIIPFFFKIYSTVKIEKPDIIHAHAMFFCGIPAIIIGKWKKIPVVYEFRSLWMFQKSTQTKNFLVKFIENILFKIESFTLRKSDFAILLNQNLMEYLSKNKALPVKYRVIENAVNTSLISELKNKITPKKRPLIFGYIGTLTTYEGIEFMIECFQELHDEGVINKLLIYGKGISTDGVVGQIKKRKDVNTIQYKGSIHPNDIYQAFSEIDVIINPRLSTKLTNSITPLKPLEAMAYGKIFLGSDVGGITELIENNKTGLIFQAENKDSLKENIRKIISLTKDQKNVLIQDSSNYVLKNKSWIMNAQKYHNIYTQLVKKFN